MPFLGAAIGGATGAALGAAQDYGVDDNFARRVGEGLTPGAAALFVLVDNAVTEKVLPKIAPYGGQLIQTSLSPEEDQHLRDAISAAKAAAPASAGPAVGD
jgi:uncharacterized membrane protein